MPYDDVFWSLFEKTGSIDAYCNYIDFSKAAVKLRNEHF